MKLQERVKELLSDMGMSGADTVGVTDEMVEHINKLEVGARRLKLTNSTITPLAFKALLNKFSNVGTIDFTGTKIPASSLDDLISFISTNTSLKDVTLEDCGFAPEELIRITSAVKTSLERLDVSNNSLLTTRGKVFPTESQIVSIFKILKDQDMVLRVSQSSVISPITQRYLTLCKEAKGAECIVGVGMQHLSGAEERSSITRIKHVNNLVANYSRLGAGYANRLAALNPSDFQAFRIAGVLEFFEIALVVQAGISKDQAKGICSSVKTQLNNISIDVNADIAFANEVAIKCSTGARWHSVSYDKIGLSLQGFDRLRKCEDLVRNALKLKHGFSEGMVEDQIKELKRQAAQLIEVTNQQKAEADTRQAQEARYKSEDRAQKQSEVRRDGDSTKAQKSLGKHVVISRNR